MIDHTICITDEAIAWRIVQDQRAIENLRLKGHPVKAVISYHSEMTAETHAVPIFELDELHDVCNRYFDFFPEECKRAMKETEDMKAHMDRADGMSKAKTMMASLRIPVGLWMMLEAWNSEMWEIEKGQFKHPGLVKQLTRYMPKLKMQQPYGKASIIVP